MQYRSLWRDMLRRAVLLRAEIQACRAWMYVTHKPVRVLYLACWAMHGPLPAYKMRKIIFHTLQSNKKSKIAKHLRIDGSFDNYTYIVYSLKSVFWVWVEDVGEVRLVKVVVLGRMALHALRASRTLAGRAGLAARPALATSAFTCRRRESYLVRIQQCCITDTC